MDCAHRFLSYQTPVRPILAGVAVLTARRRVPLTGRSLRVQIWTPLQKPLGSRYTARRRPPLGCRAPVAGRRPGPARLARRPIRRR